jgi:hypothetical protein
MIEGTARLMGRQGSWTFVFANGEWMLPGGTGKQEGIVVVSTLNGPNDK